MTVSFGLKGLCTLTLYTRPQHGLFSTSAVWRSSPCSSTPGSWGSSPPSLTDGLSNTSYFIHGKLITKLAFLYKSIWRPAQQARHSGFTTKLWNQCMHSWLEHGGASLWQVKRRTQKIHVNPQIFITLQYPPSQVCICVPFDCLSPFHLVSPCDSTTTQYQWKAIL